MKVGVESVKGVKSMESETPLRFSDQITKAAASRITLFRANFLRLGVFTV